mmetsp:Transcript_39296/g.62934  ORF Transcript_39296/g.62934 Transcript_39296/m.62934 type:complete len:101 (+) Transcript_39296:1558-1860(+)
MLTMQISSVHNFVIESFEVVIEMSSNVSKHLLQILLSMGKENRCWRRNEARWKTHKERFSLKFVTPPPLVLLASTCQSAETTQSTKYSFLPREGSGHHHS